MIAFVIGGRAWVYDIAQFHGLAVWVLGVLAILVLYAFRRTYLGGGQQARLRAARDGALLADARRVGRLVDEMRARAAALRRGLEAELGLAVELLSRCVPPLERTP